MGAMIKYVEINKANDNDWFKLDSNDDGTKWEGSCWYVYNLIKYEFKLEFEIPAGYPTVPIEYNCQSSMGRHRRCTAGERFVSTSTFRHSGGITFPSLASRMHFRLPLGLG